MNVITVTRDYGAGGYDVARRLADALGWELLDRELLHRAAAVEHVSDAELERMDEKAIPLADRFRLHPPHRQYIHGLRQAAEQAAAKGNVVLVGRGTGHLLAGSANVFHLRLAAAQPWRARRMAAQEGWTLEEALARCAAEDRNRERFTRYFFGEAPFHLAAYHAVCNTERIPLQYVADSVTALVRNETAVEPAGGAPRVLTLSRELGAGETSFAQALAGRLGLDIYDRQLLEQEAARLGVAEADLAKLDEHPAGLFQRLRPGGLAQRAFEVLGGLMNELAERGDVLLVGRGGSWFLRQNSRAFHVRLTAPLDVRVRRVMEHRWVREGPARQLVGQSDDQRGRFYKGHFGADWSDPLEYHVTVNTGLLGPAAVDLVALAAGRHWARPQT